MKPTLTPWENDLAYLQDELRWVAVRAERLGLERRRDATPDDRVSRRGGYHVEDERIEPHVLAKRIEVASAAEQELRQTIDARLELHRSTGGLPLGLDRLVGVHGLDEFERVVLILAAGPAVSRRIEKLYAAIDGERNPSLTPDVIFAFLSLSSAERIARRAALGPRGRLLSSDLIEMSFGGRTPTPKDLLGVEVELRGRAFSVMLGDTGLGDELADLARLEEPRATFDRLVLPAEDRRRILSVIDGHERFLAARSAWGLDDAITYGRGIILQFDGPSGTGKTMAAHAIAERLGRRVMNVDIATFAAHEEAGTFLPSLFREARLQNALLFLDECESLLYSRQFGNPLMGLLLAELEQFSGIAVLATNLPSLLDPALDRRVLVRVHFDLPDRAGRRSIWAALLPPTVPLAADVDLDRLAEVELAGGAIKNAVLVAAATAVYEATEIESAKITHAMFVNAAKDQGEGRRLTPADHDRAEYQRAASRAPRPRPAGFL